MLYRVAIAAAVLLLTSSTWAAPAPIPDRVHIEKRSSAPGTYDAPNLPTQLPTPPPGSSGSLRGSPELAGYNPAFPVDLQPDDAVVPTESFTLAPAQTADPTLGLYLDFSTNENPQPIRGGTADTGPTDPGPRNRPIDRESSDFLAPPGTDTGDAPSIKWPLGLSHNRLGLQNAGWSRQQNQNNIPVADAMAGVDMYLGPNAYRELHWHQANEWSLILNGSVRVTATDESGKFFIDDLQAGDVWFFPAGKPHSIQAFDTGAEFLLVFDSGDFSDDNTFLVSELFQRNPRSVLAKDLRVDVSAFDALPDGQLYIFPGTPAPVNISEQNTTGPAGSIPMSGTYSYHFSQQAAMEVPGGSVKVIDPLSFPVASNFAVALFTIKPGAMRELHWHTTSDEWSFFIGGQGRLTAYIAPEASRTFDFEAGDCGYVPVPIPHYLENTGSEDLIYLEVLQAPVYGDISVAQWLGLTPQQIVKDHLGFSQDTLDRLPKDKPFILPGNVDMLTTDFTEESE